MGCQQVCGVRLSRRLVSPMYCLGQWLHYLYHVNDVLWDTVDVMRGLISPVEWNVFVLA